MAETTDTSALEKELLEEHTKGYQGFLSFSVKCIIFIVLLLIGMAIFLV